MKRTAYERPTQLSTLILIFGSASVLLWSMGCAAGSFEAAERKVSTGAKAPQPITGESPEEETNQQSLDSEQTEEPTTVDEGNQAPPANPDEPTDTDAQGSERVVPAAPAEFTDEDSKALSGEDQRLLAACLKQWPNHPFTAGQTYRVRKVSTSLSIGGITLAGDDSPTVEPKLVLMKTSINLNVPGFTGMATYNFMNPNGYYCLANQFNVLADVRINLHCQARLASGENQFSVLSATNGSVSQSQVNVLSNVFVIRSCQ